MDLTKIVDYLSGQRFKIATMESCTGGLLASLITDVPGASNVFNYSAVTYSTEHKIKMGVNKETIDNYSVYSAEVAKEMAFNVCKFSSSDVGVGITGKLLTEEDKGSEVDICLYLRPVDRYFWTNINVYGKTRQEQKLEVIKAFVELFNSTFGLD